MEFFIGDVVILKSGGPKMVVSTINMDSMDMTCIWYTNGKCEMQVVDPQAVRKYNS